MNREAKRKWARALYLLTLGGRLRKGVRKALHLYDEKAG
jgi:hypothetical protein